MLLPGPGWRDGCTRGSGPGARVRAPSPSPEVLRPRRRRLAEPPHGHACVPGSPLPDASTLQGRSRTRLLVTQKLDVGRGQPRPSGPVPWGSAVRAGAPSPLHYVAIREPWDQSILWQGNLQNQALAALHRLPRPSASVGTPAMRLSPTCIGSPRPAAWRHVRRYDSLPVSDGKPRPRSHSWAVAAPISEPRCVLEPQLLMGPEAEPPALLTPGPPPSFSASVPSPGEPASPSLGLCFARRLGKRTSRPRPPPGRACQLTGQVTEGGLSPAQQPRRPAPSAWTGAQPSCKEARSLLVIPRTLGETPQLHRAVQ